MTRPRHTRDWRALILAAVALTFLFAAALTADGQQTTCPTMPDHCAKWRLPCPYPSAWVSPAQQREIIALGGPWVAQGSPPPGMKRSYPTAEDWRRDAWDRSYAETSWVLYCRDGASCGVSDSAWRKVARIVKPMGHEAVCFSWSGDHDESYVRYVQLYRQQPTMAQYLELRCASDRGAGAGWAPDGRLDQAWRCREGVTVPEPQPEPPPPVPVPPPSPPEPSTCTPLAGSACQARCTQVGRDPDWCLDPARETGARHLFTICSGVCRGDEPEEPDEPDPEEPGGVLLFHLPVEVREGGAFVRGVFVPSTGVLEVQLLPIEEEESP